MQIAYLDLLFGRNVIDGRDIMRSVLNLSIGSGQGTGDIEYGEIYDIYFPPEFLRLFDGPSCNIMGMTNVNVCTTEDFTGCVGALVGSPGGRGVRDHGRLSGLSRPTSGA